MLCGNNGASEPFTQNLGTCKTDRLEDCRGLIAFNRRLWWESIP